MPAVVCMLEQGRFHQAVEYARSKAWLEVADYVAILHQRPSAALVDALFPSFDKSLIPLGVLVTTLLKTDAYEVGLKLVERLHVQGMLSN